MNKHLMLVTVLAGGGAVDITRPSVAITSSETSPSFAATIPLTITFSESVTGFEVGDITVVGCTLGTLSGSGAVYTVTATPTANTITVDIAEGVAADGAGNTNTAATQFPMTSLWYGLSLWLKADTIAGNDSDTVAAWADQSGNGKDFAQTDNDKKPLLKKAANGINNLAVVRFDGSNDSLYRAENILNTSSGIIFAIVRMNTAFANFETLLCSADEATNNYYFVLRPYESATHARMAISQKNNDTVDQAKGSTALQVDTAYLMAWASTGTAYSLRFNGRVETNSVVSGSDSGDWLADTTLRDSFTIGIYKGSSEASPFKGDLGELLMYNALPAAGIITAIETYLAARWGITLLNP